jgi:hypothetical protein
MRNLEDEKRSGFAFANTIKIAGKRDEMQTTLEEHETRL